MEMIVDDSTTPSEKRWFSYSFIFFSFKKVSVKQYMSKGV